jgi:hypothetical protein
MQVQCGLRRSKTRWPFRHDAAVFDLGDERAIFLVHTLGGQPECDHFIAYTSLFKPAYLRSSSDEKFSWLIWSISASREASDSSMTGETEEVLRFAELFRSSLFFDDSKNLG